MKEFGKTTFLEVVSYNEREGLNGAKIAAECHCDFLMGTKFFDSIKYFCKERAIRYMPFVGKVSGREGSRVHCRQREQFRAIERVEKFFSANVYNRRRIF